MLPSGLPDLYALCMFNVSLKTWDVSRIILKIKDLHYALHTYEFWIKDHSFSKQDPFSLSLRIRKKTKEIMDILANVDSTV